MTTAPIGVSHELVADPGLLAQIVEVSADAIFSEGLDGRIISWNAGAERLYGRSAKDMLGRSTAELLPDATASQLRVIHTLALSGERVERFDTSHQRHDGRNVAVSLTVSPLRDQDGEIAGLATSVQDVSDRVRLTDELAGAHRTLERQFSAVTRSNRDLEQFAYLASHDLSEPLRAISGFVRLLEKRYANSFDEQGTGYLTQIIDGAARMRSLIDDLLEYSRFLSADTPDRSVDTAAVAARVARAMKDSNGSSIEIADLPSVWCNEAAVHAVLANLLSNAVKFHRPDASSRVVITGDTDAGFVRLCVDDDGIGIQPEHRRRVFGMFARLHTREEYAGTGIGLAIVQQIAERSGGRSWMESSPLGGSRFCVTFPVPPSSGRDA